MKNFLLFKISVLGMISILSIIIFNSLSGLQFDYNIDSFFNQDDEDVKFYNEHVARFENDNNFLLIGIDHKQNVFDLEFMNKVSNLSNELKENQSVISILSPTTVKEKSITSVGAFSRPLINLESQAYLNLDKSKIESSSDYYTALFSMNWESILIHVKIAKSIDFESGQRLLKHIKSKVKSYDFNNAHYGGRINTRGYYVKNIEQQSVYFILISITLLIAFLYYCFRTFLGVLLPLIVLGLSILISLSIVNFGLGKLDIMLSMLPTIVFVVGVSYSIHILSVYAEEIKKQSNKLIAIIQTIKSIWSTIAITAITTSIGFLSLYLIEIRPIQNFAIYNAIAILITGLASLIILPVLISLFNPKYIFKTTAIVASHGNSHALFLKRVLVKSKFIHVLGGIVILFFIWGSSQIRTNSNFLDDLSSESELGKELSFFESNFGGIRPFEMSVNFNNKNIMSYNSILKMEKVHNYLEDTYKVSGLTSPITLIKSANKAFNSGLNKNYILPKDERSFKELIANMIKKKVFKKYANIISSDFMYGRFYGRSLDSGSQNFRSKNKSLHHFLVSNGTDSNFHLTGSAELMDNANSKIATKLLLGIGMGVFFVTFLIAMIFGSIRIALISILPNIFPVLIVAGFMGFLGIELKVGTALAFTIIFGIAVDDTIHLMKRIKGELKINNEMSIAIQKTYQSTGKAVVLSSLIISAGFLAFVTSEFTGLFYFGILISIGIFTALIADYVLLPILLLKIHPHSFVKKR